MAKKHTAKTSVPQEGVALGLNPVPPKVPQYHIPTPAPLRQKIRIQQEVQQRLKELSEKIHTGNGKIKFQRGGPVHFFVNRRIKCPPPPPLSMSLPVKIRIELCITS